MKFPTKSVWEYLSFPYIRVYIVCYWNTSFINYLDLGPVLIYLSCYGEESRGGTEESESPTLATFLSFCFFRMKGLTNNIQGAHITATAINPVCIVDWSCLTKKKKIQPD